MKIESVYNFTDQMHVIVPSSVGLAHGFRPFCCQRAKHRIEVCAPSASYALIIALILNVGVTLVGSTRHPKLERIGYSDRNDGP